MPWEPFVNWANSHPPLSVLLALILIVPILAIFKLTWSHWVSPKLTAIDNLQTKVGTLDGTISQFLASRPTEVLSRMEASLSTLQANVGALQDGRYAEAIGNLTARVSALESANDAERRLQQEQHKGLQEAVTRSIEEMRQLQKRSEKEIQRMQAEDKYAWALEQAGQDVVLAEIAEQLSRLTPALHPSALERLAKAKSRLESLREKFESLPRSVGVLNEP